MAACARRHTERIRQCRNRLWPSCANDGVLVDRRRVGSFFILHRPASVVPASSAQTEPILPQLRGLSPACADQIFGAPLFQKRA